jgi:hypothetical protein
VRGEQLRLPRLWASAQRRLRDGGAALAPVLQRLDNPPPHRGRSQARERDSRHQDGGRSDGARQRDHGAVFGSAEVRGRRPRRRRKPCWGMSMSQVAGGIENTDPASFLVARQLVKKMAILNKFDGCPEMPWGDGPPSTDHQPTLSRSCRATSNLFAAFRPGLREKRAAQALMPPLRLMNWPKTSESDLYAAAYRISRDHLLRVLLSALAGSAVHRMMAANGSSRPPTHRDQPGAGWKSHLPMSDHGFHKSPPRYINKATVRPRRVNTIGQQDYSQITLWTYHQGNTGKAGVPNSIAITDSVHVARP